MPEPKRASQGAEDDRGPRERYFAVGLSGPLAFSDSRIFAFGLGPETLQNPAPEGRIPSPRTRGNLRFSFGVVDDFSLGLEGRVGDQFWHPEGVQLKAPNYGTLQ